MLHETTNFNFINDEAIRKNFICRHQLIGLVRNHDVKAVKNYVEEYSSENLHVEEIMNIVDDYGMFLALIGDKPISNDMMEKILDNAMSLHNTMIIDFLVKYGIESMSIILIYFNGQHGDMYNYFDYSCDHEDNNNDRCINPFQRS